MVRDWIELLRDYTECVGAHHGRQEHMLTTAVARLLEPTEDPVIYLRKAALLHVVRGTKLWLQLNRQTWVSSIMVVPVP